jgi:hypothetical protein
MEMKMDINEWIGEEAIKGARVIEDEAVSIKVKDVLVVREVVVKNRSVSLIIKFRRRHVWQDIEMLWREEGG